jgi:alpha-ketoglutarate-dependent taurine dioxygenase
MTHSTLPYLWSSPNTPEPADIGTVMAAEEQKLDELLYRHGAILFRGFGIDTAERFQSFIDGLPGKKPRYIDGNSPRTKVSHSVYTSTEYPPEVWISLHNELSYSYSWPSRLYFCCVVPAQTGGSTTVADSRAILRRLSPATVRLFEEKGVTYVRNLHGGSGATIGKSWQQTFETESKADVEAYCQAGNIQYEWKPDGSVRLVQKGPGTLAHPKTGERVWFNQIEQFHPSSNPPEVYEALSLIYGDTPFDMPQYACFGDGQPESDEILAEIRAAMVAETVAFPWERGDVMIVDNVLAAHGRSPFTGPRKILLSMTV